MGNVQPSKLLDSKLMDSNTITGLSYLEDGQFAKIYKVDEIVMIAVGLDRC